jgi:PAS domain-containing protein
LDLPVLIFLKPSLAQVDMVTGSSSISMLQRRVHLPFFVKRVISKWRLHRMHELFESGFATSKMLDLIEEKLSLGFWIWNLEIGAMKWSKGLYALLGLQPDAILPTYAAMEQLVHIDDRRPLGEIERALRESVSIDREFRIVMPDHRVRWIRSLVWPLMAAGSAPSTAIGIYADITKSHNALHFLKLMSDRFSALSSTVNAIIWTATPDGSRVEIVNRRPAKAVSGTDLKAMVHPDDRATLDAQFASSRAFRQPFRAILRLRADDGSHQLHWSRAVPIMDDRGEIREWAGISHDPKAIEREWSTAAGVQALTGSQIRAARAVLRWSVADLANAAGVSPAVIRRLEEVDSASSAEAAHEAIEAALHDAGVEFTRGPFGKPGVRPR